MLHNILKSTYKFYLVYFNQGDPQRMATERGRQDYKKRNGHDSETIKTRLYDQRKREGTIVKATV